MPLGSGLLSCQVHDANQRVFTGATVSVIDEYGRTRAHGETDAFGFFVAALPRGTYKVTVTTGGYELLSTEAKVRPGAHTALGELTLRPQADLTLPKGGTWKLDPAHSAVRFIAKHIGLTRVYGQFNQFDGVITMADPVMNSSVDVVIGAASIYTKHNERDAHLRSAEFLAVDRHPHIYFTGSQFTHIRGDKWALKGSLSIHGITSSVVMDTTYHGIREWNGTRIGFAATTTLHREDFTLNYNQMASRGIAVIGSTIEVYLDVQAILEK
jgi:polyisoprenoid-binding protein YceI